MNSTTAPAATMPGDELGRALNKLSRRNTATRRAILAAAFTVIVAQLIAQFVFDSLWPMLVIPAALLLETWALRRNTTRYRERSATLFDHPSTG